MRALLDGWFNGERGYWQHRADRLNVHWSQRDWEQVTDWDSYYTFTTVRDPLERLVSEYTWAKVDERGMPFFAADYASGTPPMPFRDWILAERYQAKPICEFAPGANRVFSLHDQRRIVNELAARFRKDPGVEMPFVNTTEHGPVSEYYDAETEAAVLKRFASDLAVVKKA